jgi:serine/threonine protein kinase
VGETHGFVIKEKHSKHSEGAYGLVMNVDRDDKEYVGKFFGYTIGNPDTNWILREIDNLTHLKGIEGAVQIEATFMDTRAGLLPHPHRKQERYLNQVYPVIILEKLSGGILFERITSMTSFSEQDACIIFKSFMTALQDIHTKRNMINCDLKADNLVFKSLHSSVVKIIDFGMAVNLGGRECHYDKNLQGTTQFLAPESILSKRECGQAQYSRSSDIWQAGCILYFLLSGSIAPFNDESKTAIEDNILLSRFTSVEPDNLPISMAAKKLLKRMLTNSPEERITVDGVLKDEWIVRIDKLPTTNYRASFDNELLLKRMFRHEFLKMWDITKAHVDQTTDAEGCRLHVQTPSITTYLMASSSSSRSNPRPHSEANSSRSAPSSTGTVNPEKLISAINSLKASLISCCMRIVGADAATPSAADEDRYQSESSPKRPKLGGAAVGIAEDNENIGHAHQGPVSMSCTASASSEYKPERTPALNSGSIAGISVPESAFLTGTHTILNWRGIDRDQFVELFSQHSVFKYLATHQFFDIISIGNRRNNGYVDYLECLFGVATSLPEVKSTDWQLVAHIVFHIVDIEGRGIITADVIKQCFERYFRATGTSYMEQISQFQPLLFPSPEQTYSEREFVELFLGILRPDSLSRSLHPLSRCMSKR